MNETCPLCGSVLMKTHTLCGRECSRCDFLYEYTENDEKYFEGFLLHYSGFETDVDTEDLQLLFHKIDELIIRERFDLLDDMCVKFMLSSLSYELKESFLRYTFVVKHEIPMWEQAMDLLVNDLEKYQMDVDSILKGIYNEKNKTIKKRN